ncbi:MAG TPA: zinc-finger domain-containing protein [Rudaea sp.]|nr:zinc-finger domain-containing protein [Rudaea sp.]
MSETLSATPASTLRPIPANAQNAYEITHADLPLSCPMPGMALWNSHPKVYLAVEATGRAKCPYCGAQYTLKD